MFTLCCPQVITKINYWRKHLCQCKKQAHKPQHTKHIDTEINWSKFSVKAATFLYEQWHKHYLYSETCDDKLLSQNSCSECFSFVQRFVLVQLPTTLLSSPLRVSLLVFYEHIIKHFRNFWTLNCLVVLMCCTNKFALPLQLSLQTLITGNRLYANWQIPDISETKLATVQYACMITITIVSN